MRPNRLALPGLAAVLWVSSISEGFTLIDLRPLRLLFSAARTKKSDPELMRIVHGFDAILVLTGSRPSQMM